MTEDERKALRFAAAVELREAISRVVALMPPSDDQIDADQPSEGEVVTDFVVVAHTTSLALLDAGCGGRYVLLTPAEDPPIHHAEGLLSRGARMAGL